VSKRGCFEEDAREKDVMVHIHRFIFHIMLASCFPPR
jgi:hypothetical protein